MSGWTLGLSPSDTWSTVPEVSSFPAVVAEGFPEVVAEGGAESNSGLGVQSAGSSSTPQKTVSSVWEVGPLVAPCHGPGWLGPHHSYVAASPPAELVSPQRVSVE